MVVNFPVTRGVPLRCKVDLHYYTRFIRACQTERKGLRNRQTVCGRALRKPFCKWFKRGLNAAKTAIFGRFQKIHKLLNFRSPIFAYFYPAFLVYTNGQTC